VVLTTVSLADRLGRRAVGASVAIFTLVSLAAVIARDESPERLARGAEVPLAI